MDSIDVKRTILNYLLKHPGSRDSIDGIAWWVLKGRIDLGLEQVRVAVNELIAENILVSRDLGQVAKVVELNRERNDDIRELVSHRKSAGSGGDHA